MQHTCRSRATCLVSHPPLLPHSLSPSSPHIVLLPVSLSVINYKRHKPPGLLPCLECLPSGPFWRAKRLASLITPGALFVSPFAGPRRSPRRARLFTGPKDTGAFPQSAEENYFSLRLQQWKCFVSAGYVRHINNE